MRNRITEIASAAPVTDVNAMVATSACQTIAGRLVRRAATAGAATVRAGPGRRILQHEQGFHFALVVPVAHRDDGDPQRPVSEIDHNASLRCVAGMCTSRIFSISWGDGRICSMVFRRKSSVRTPNIWRKARLAETIDRSGESTTSATGSEATISW